MLYHKLLKFALILSGIGFSVNLILYYFFKGFLYSLTSNELKLYYPNYHFLLEFSLSVIPILSLLFILLLIIKSFSKLANFKERIFYFLILSTIFLFLELSLLMMNYKPGVFVVSKWFEPVDSVYLLDGFVADQNGITKINPIIRNYLEKGITKIPDNKKCFEVYGLREEYKQLLRKDNDSELNLFYKSIHNKTPTELDQAILSYLHCPINQEGFKSIEFKKINAKKPSILLLGDSFTWGHSASNKGNGFADRLLARGFTVYNTGISGADPIQYLQIAQKWIEVLKPDFVIVNFFIGNDIMNYERIPKANIPIYFSTSVSNLYSTQQGVSFENAQETYDYIILKNGIPQNSLHNKLFSTFRSTTLLWKFLGFEYYECFNSKQKKATYKKMAIDNQTTKKYTVGIISQIKTVAAKHNSKFILSIIPEVKNGKLRGVKEIEGLDFGFKYYSPIVTLKDYELGDGHFNDSGHLKYTNFLEKLIQKRS